MNVFSVFDGMSTGQIALNKAGIVYNNYYASEINKDCIKVTQAHFPKTIQLGDISNIKGSDLPDIFLYIGGSPCQSFTNTISSNTGFDGKSKLFFEYVRLLKECKPKYFLLENVQMKKEWEDIITFYMGVKPVLINSDLFSAQSRPRLYWTNIPFGKLPSGNTQVLKDILENNVEEKYYYKESYAYHGDSKVVCATLAINGHDILKRVNSPLHKCQTLTAVCGGNQQKKVLELGIIRRVRRLTPIEYEKLQTIPENFTSMVSNSARYKMLGNGWTCNVISFIFLGLADSTITTS